MILRNTFNFINTLESFLQWGVILESVFNIFNI